VIEAFQYVDVRDGSLPPTRFYEHLRGYLAYVETPSSHFLRQKNITNDLLTKNKILGEDDRKQKTVTFLFYGYERNFDTDSFICTIIFSVISTELIGTPYEVAKTYRFQISLTSRLMSFWNIPNALELGQNKISDEMIKIALQSAEEYISLLIRSGEILDDRLQPWNRTTENSPETCPYNLANVDYPKKMSFVVELADFPDSNGENIRKMKDEIEGLKKKLNKVESAQPKRNPLQPRPGQKDVGWNIKK